MYSTEELTLYDTDGVPIGMLNETLLNKQNNCNLHQLKQLHTKRHALELEMLNANDKQQLKQLLLEWTEVQFDLQEAWGFPKDATFHPSHRLPKCGCPKMDNDERIGTPYKVINEDCPLHA